MDTLLAKIEVEVDGRKLGGFSAWRTPDGSWQVNLKLPNGAFECHTVKLSLEGSLLKAFGLGAPAADPDNAEPEDPFGGLI